jgi:Na+/H+ antiporter NhaA
MAFLFGLVNAGVLWRGVDTGTWAVLVASLVGRPVGILATAATAGISGLVPEGSIQWSDLVVIAFISSVGGVFALFLSTTVFPDGPLLTQVKLGAMATVVGAPLAWTVARTLGVSWVERRQP